ncbi:MAG: CcdB family protein [Azonexus sp.]|jgi:toxin CcdB|nr:CcdB family protein [Azonexus sp.]
MSQFDVHRNKGKNAVAIPFVVIVQSAVFDNLKRRIVVPLVVASCANTPQSAVTPRFTVGGAQVVLNPLEITSVPLAALGDFVVSLAEAGDEIVAALDEVFSRAWG